MRVDRELRDGEYRVVSVAPTARGISIPLIVTVAAVVLTVVACNTWSIAREHRLIVATILVVPGAVVLGGRLWRWRSHRVTVTNQRILITSGVANRRLRTVELIDVVSVGLDQRWYERLIRRGHVLLETNSGVVDLDRVRRPDALWRVIDYERQQLTNRDRARLDHADELSRARDVGDISDQEYESRWRHLFGPDGARG